MENDKSNSNNAPELEQLDESRSQVVSIKASAESISVDINKESVANCTKEGESITDPDYGLQAHLIDPQKVSPEHKMLDNEQSCTRNVDALDTGQSEHEHEMDKDRDRCLEDSNGAPCSVDIPEGGLEVRKTSVPPPQHDVDIHNPVQVDVKASGDLNDVGLKMTRSSVGENELVNTCVDSLNKEALETIREQLDSANNSETNRCDTNTVPLEIAETKSGASQNETSSSVQMSQNESVSLLHSRLGDASNDASSDSCVDSSNKSKCDIDNAASIGCSYVPVRDAPVTSNIQQTEDESDALLSQLESELRTEIPESDQTEVVVQTKIVSSDNVLNSEPSNVQLDPTLNGISPQVLKSVPEFLDLQNKYDTLQKLNAEKDIEIKRLQKEKNLISGSLQNALRDKDQMNERLKAIEEKSTSGEQTHLNMVKELENTIAQQQQEHESTKETLKQHDEMAKKTINQLKNDLQAKLSQISKAYDECKREKEGMVVKYAVAEQKNIEMEDRMHKNIKKTQEWEREKDLAVNKFKTIRADRAKLEEAFHQRNAEIVSLRRELEKFKELRNEQELKTKWHQNKLKSELEAHKETKGKLEDVSKKLKQARDEAENMKRECQAMIKQYQETEEQQKNSLAAKIGEKEEELKQRKQEVTDQQEVHSLVKNQLETLKRNHKDMIEELRTAKDKITCLEAERLHQEETLKKFKETLQHQKQDNKDLYDKLAALEGVEQQLSIEKEKVASMKVHVEELEELNRDLRADMEGCAKREGEHLEFTRRVSDKNAKLQSENSSLSNKLAGLNEEYSEINKQCREQKEAAEKLESELTEEKARRIEEVGSLTVKLEDKSKAVEELSQQLEDQRDDNKVLKRRHAANVKDLHRQLQQAHKKLEKGSMNGEISSMGSRTSSNNSLNTLVNSEQPPMGSTSPIQEEIPIPQEPEAPIVQFVEVDKQVLVEKIVRLQKAHARKNEKIEFMEEHVNQLVNELQRKARVIQNYVMREESGTLSPESMDLNKAQLSKKGGIMASVYNSTSRDDHMTFDLSLQINHKLQAVLEDTLLKNITLKESMDTLGKEISELSKQNRTLQLHIRTLEERLPAKS